MSCYRLYCSLYFHACSYTLRYFTSRCASTVYILPNVFLLNTFLLNVSLLNVSSLNVFYYRLYYSLCFHACPYALRRFTSTRSSTKYIFLSIAYSLARAPTRSSTITVIS
jgi:hypothetical protein